MSYRNFLLLLLLPAMAGSQDLNTDSGIRAITIPSADVTLSFVQPGNVINVLFKEGDMVQEDQAVSKLDDTVERASLSQLLAESQNTTRIDAAEASLSQKRVDLQRIMKAAERNAATDLEVQHSSLEARIAELSLNLAKFEHEQAQRKLKEGQARLDRMVLKSPLKGTVEEVHIEKGESVNALDEVIRIVRIDPLWVDASLPLAKAIQLKTEQTVSVQFTGPSGNTVSGRIIFIGAVADAASGTLKARIEIPNKTNRPAGEYVLIHVSPASQ